MGYQMLIDGNLVSGTSEMGVINPAFEEGFAQTPVADRAMLEKAMDAGVSAFSSWSKLGIETRGEYLVKLADAMEARIHDFARLLTQEQGKPLEVATGEMFGTIAALRYFAEARLHDRIIQDDDEVKVFEHRTPLGLIAGITPWNYPMILLAMKIGPALITGNTMIAKPAPTTPLTTMLIGEIAADILPAGVLQTILTTNEDAALLTRDPRVAMTSFTGSTATGKKVYASGADTLKRMQLELGGNDAAIVLDDVDVSKVAESIFAAAMTNSGQICMAAKRVYAPRNKYGDLVEALGALADKAVVGDGLEQGTQYGPIQNDMQFKKVVEYYNDGVANGRVAGGKGVLDRKGYFVHPTIIADIPNESRLVQEEQFGPVLPILPYDSEDEAFAKANDSEYGLAGTIWTADVERAEALSRNFDTGTTWINKHADVRFDVEFGGCKQSGIGRQNGEEGMLEMTQGKIVNIAKSVSF